MKKIGIIINPRSKSFRDDPVSLTNIKNLLEEKSEPEILYEITNETDDIEKAAKRFKDNGIEILAISGGDGTCRVTLTRVINVYGSDTLPQILILRGGTMNTIASSLKIRGKPESILKRLLDSISSGEELNIIKRHILHINDRYGFIFGNGFFYNFLETYYEQAYPYVAKGFLLVCKTFFSALFNTSFSKKIFKGFNVSLTINGEKIQMENMGSITCSTIPYIGFGFTPYKRTLEKEGHFHLLCFPNNKKQIISQIPNLFSGNTKEGNLPEYVIERVKMETDEAIGYQLDGDCKKDTKVLDISTGPLIHFITL